MVSANKLVYDFVRKLNSVNSGQAQSFRVVDIVSFLNEAYEIWYENKVFAAETNDNIRNDLRVFEVKKEKLKVEEVDCDCVKFDYPDGYYKTLNTVVKACNTECCGDIFKKIIVKPVQSDDLETTRRNPYQRSDFKWERVIGDEAGTSMYLYLDESMDVKEAYLSYYRIPKYIQAPELVECEEDGYRNYDNELITKNVDLEVDAFAGRQIVELADYLASDASKDYNQSQATIKRILQLDTLYR